MRPTKELQAAQFLANFSAWCEHCYAPAVEITGSLPDRCEIMWSEEWQGFCERQMIRQDIGIGAHDNFPGTSLEGYRDAKFTKAGAQLITRWTPDGHLRIEADFDGGVPVDAHMGCPRRSDSVTSQVSRRRAVGSYPATRLDHRSGL